MSGVGNRINVDSTDLSHNVVTVTPPELFAAIRQVLQDSVEDAETRGRLVGKLEELETARNTPKFGALYIQFMSILADHASLMALLAPHLPGLAQLAVR